MKEVKKKGALLLLIDAQEKKVSPSDAQDHNILRHISRLWKDK
jgi:hypothetical protein